MEKIEWMQLQAKRYREDCNKSINRNWHMNRLGGSAEFTQDQIDAILVGFINRCATNLGVDLAMYTSDLVEADGQKSGE